MPTRKTKLDDATMHFYFSEYLTFKFCLYMFFINKVFVKVPEDVLKRTETVVELKAECFYIIYISAPTNTVDSLFLSNFSKL